MHIIEKYLKEIPVLMYHRFINSKSTVGKSVIYLNIKKSEKHFKFLKKQNFTTITFADLLDDRLILKLDQGRKFIIITVDDGYLDNYELLFPLLKKYNFKAVIYMVTETSYNKWDVEKLQEPKLPLMSKEQLQEMVASGLVEIGGHTLTHPRLSKLTKEQQYLEIKKNKQQLEQIINKKIISFAYPYSDFNQNAKNNVKKSGYNFAVIIENANNISHEDLYQIKRIQIFPWDDTITLWLKIAGYYRNKNCNLVVRSIVFLKKNLFIMKSFMTKSLFK